MKEKDSRAQFSMPFGLESQNERGTIKLNETVIASVVKNATLSVNGVMRLAGNSLSNSIAGLLGTKKRNDSAITIELSDDHATVEVNIIVEYGENIPALGVLIQSTIINEVKKIAGISVSQVHINVHGVEEIEEEVVEVIEEVVDETIEESIKTTEKAE
jgi:uncharacterized alkaline shock family protein YloU